MTLCIHHKSRRAKFVKMSLWHEIYIRLYFFFFFFLKKQKAPEDLLPPPLNCWRRQWQPTPVLLPGTSHGGRSLVGYSPWGHKESDMAEQLHFTHFTHFTRFKLSLWRRQWQPTPVFLPGESMDRGAWRVMVHGVAESQTCLE